MKDLFRKFGLLFLVSVMIVGTGLPAIPAAQADGTCAQWTLVDASSTQVTSVSPNQISAGDAGFDASTPPVSMVPGASWQCTKKTATSASILTSQDQQLSQGTESCQKAVALSAQFGGFTALDTSFSSKIQKSVLDDITNFLKSSVSSTTGLSLNFNQIASTTGLMAAGGFIQDQFNKLFGNPLKSAIASSSQQIMDAAKKQADEIAQKYLGDITQGVVDILGVNTSVPVNDSGTQKKLDVVNQSINGVIAEQKRAQLIQDTRDKCNNLLNTTVATIKKALLYQLSTQISDWIQSGQTPQFIKQPWKALQDTGNLALDRFISRVAPQLCQPFRFAVQIQIPTVAREANPFYEQVTCSLAQATNNIEGFYNDFRQGSWLTYQEVWKPQNNYYGALLMTQDAAAQTVAAATQAAQRDTAQSQGFKSQYRCIDWEKYAQAPISEVFAPTGVTRVSVNNINYDSTDPSPYSNGPTNDGNPPEPGLNQDAAGRFWSSDNSYFWECDNSEITSPGTIAAGLSQKASTADLDYLVNTNDVDNFLQTIQDSIVNKLVKAGVNGIRAWLPNALPAITPH